MANILVRGQALSLRSFSGSLEDVDTLIFEDSRDPNTLQTIRVQGIYWEGLCNLTISDNSGTVLFNHIKATSPGFRTPDISGSTGNPEIIVVAPLRMTLTSGSGPPITNGFGGILRIYGEMM